MPLSSVSLLLSVRFRFDTVDESFSGRGPDDGLSMPFMAAIMIAGDYFLDRAKVSMKDALASRQYANGLAQTRRASPQHPNERPRFSPRLGSSPEYDQYP